MKATDYLWPAILASVLGLLILKWTWLAEVLGIMVNVERTGSVITIEYVWGMAAVAFLGYLFPKLPIWCAVWFMLGPTIITHAVHVVSFGIPQQWGLEIFVLAILTIPYIGIAYGAAYVRRRSLRHPTS
jgi:hypothetical protein